MRHHRLAALALSVFLLAPAAAYAGSGQGGYLGINPGAAATSGPAADTQVGSAQGGYLGKNPASATEHVAADASSPSSWCRSSVEPSRCYGKAKLDHDYCMGKNTDPDHYASCRRALDFMGYGH